MKEHHQIRYAFSIDCVSYQKKTVLAQQNFSIPVNKWTALVGKSGHGKTTLLKTLLGLVPGLNASPPGISLSYMPQRDLLLPWKTVIENVVLGATLRRETPNISKAKSLLRDVGLADEAQNYPHHLSVGMRQRVALARTLMEDADLILMDEPFSAVDHQTRDQLHTLAKRQLEGKTVLIVSHDPDEVVKMADHVLTLSGEPAVCLSDS
ncbi:ATP-binding cassette domain-containing protein [Candidatus Finniella inopinata]|uniref:ATP-binding cassette domain-containing protein n=1 Tax=Candidatus Finniella inopinata TaxID=1696036 RepID=UPI0013EEAF6C|nr:ATP-binding cassette domain-containing protein [Candidatus Finniella inopinata]